MAPEHCQNKQGWERARVCDACASARARTPERVAAKCRRVPAKTNRLNEKQLLGQRERGRDGGEQARPNTLTPLSLSQGLKGDTVPLCPIAPSITLTTLTPHSSFLSLTLLHLFTASPRRERCKQQASLWLCLGNKLM